MSRTYKNGFLAAVVTVCAMVLLSGQTQPSRSSMVPDRFLRGYDPITVFYDNPAGPLRGGPGDGPSEWLSILPFHPGEYRWLDGKTVQFLPSVPWPPIREFRVKTKDAERVLTTMMAAPTSITPAAGSRNLDSVSTITLVFPAALDAELLASLISLEVRDLPGVDAANARRLNSSDFSIRELETQRSPTSSGFRIQLKQPITYGKRVLLHIGLSRDQSLPDALATYSFETLREFRLLAAGSSSTRLPLSSNGAVYSQDQAIDAGTGSSPLWLDFSEAVVPLSVETLKNFVHFEPAVRNLVPEFSGSRVYLRFDADKDQPYKVRLNWQSEMYGESGRALGYFGPSQFWFYYRQSAPYVSWRSTNIIVERYGPQTLPMEGRGTGRVDLRVHKIDPENLDFWPFPSNPVLIKEDSRPPMPGEEPEPGNNIAAQIRLIGSPEISKIADLPIGTSSGASTFGLNLKGELAARFGNEKPGTYLVGYRTLDAGDQRQFVRLVVTDLSLTTVEEESAVVFAVTSLKTGAPIAGARIRVDGNRRTLDGNRMNLDPLISGVTDNEGRFRYEHSRALQQTPARIVVAKDEDVLVLDVGTPPPAFANNHWFGSGGSWLDWLTQIPNMAKHLPRDHGWVVTERPVYRPEEPVHIIGWMRERKDGKLLPWTKKEKLNLIVYTEGKQWSYEVEPTGLGRVYKEFEESGDITGQYYAQLTGVVSGTVYARTTFRKESYRVPLFEVRIDAPDRVAIDKAFEAEATADYYAGGRVVGEEITWEINEYPYSVSAPAYGGFAFSTEERFGNGGFVGDFGGMSSSDVLDENGSAKIRINPAGERDGRARRYVISATVQGGDRQTVTQVRQVLALPPFVLGLKLDRFSENGNTVTPSVVVLDYNERPMAGLPLTVRLYQRQWHSYIAETDFTTGQVRYETDVVDTPVAEMSVQSTSDTQAVPFPIKEAGVYIVELSSLDKLGRRVVVKSDTFVSGPSPVSWERKRESLFELGTDLNAYRPGQTAKLIIKSPYQDAWALIAIETPENNEYAWVHVENGQGIFTIPIIASMAPGLPVTVLLQRGRVPGTETAKVDLGRPAALGASITIRVQERANQLVLSLEHPGKSTPASRLPIDIDLKDPDGRPLDGEVALWLVDKAVLSLGTEGSLDPLPHFIDPVTGRLRLRDTRNLTVGNLPVEENPGGDGAGDDEFSRLELFNRTTVRDNFKTVPFFAAAISVRNGKGHVDVDLPDNLTDFAIRAVAVSGYERFGNARSQVSVRLPVIVQSAVPRFARPGDSFEAGGLGRVVEGEGGKAIAGIKVEQFVLGPNAGKAVPGDPSAATRDFVLDDKEAERLFFPLIAPLSLQEKSGLLGAISLFIQRLSDDARDAFRIELPIRDDVPTKRAQTTQTVNQAQTIAFPEPLEAARPDSVQRTVVVARDQRLLFLLQALLYQRDYAYDCVEQRISKLFPALALKQLVNDIGRSGDFAIDEGRMRDLNAYIASAQDDEGLIGFWPGSRGYVSLTAYVLEFMAMARDANLPFDRTITDPAVAALRRSLRSDYSRLLQGWTGYDRVEALASLDRWGIFDEAYARDLLTISANLPPYSQARLLMVLANHRLQSDSKAVAAVARLESMIVTRRENNREVFAGLQDKNSVWGGPALSSETRTIAAMAEALALLAPRSSKLSVLYDALLARGGPEGWGNTMDNTAAMRAFKSLITPTAAADLTLSVSSGGSARQLAVGKRAIAVFVFDEAEALTLNVPVRPTEPLYISLWTDYKPGVRGALIKADNAGFSLTREIIRVDENGRYAERSDARNTIRYGLDQIVEDHTTLVNFEDRDFVAVTIPIAAGFEPLNPELATAPKEARPTGSLTLRPTYASYLDDKVVYYYERLPKGSYQFYFRTRASFEGSYSQPPARAERLYALSVRGSSNGAEIIIDGAAQGGR